MALVTSLDNFNDNAISASWDRWGGAQITESSGRLNLATTLAAGYYGIYYLPTTTLGANYVAVRVLATGNQALASYAGYPISADTGSNEAYWEIRGGNIRAYTLVSGTRTMRFSTPYNASAHVFLGIAVIGGALVFGYSADGNAWVQVASLAGNPLGTTTANCYVMVGTDAAEASTTTLQVDDFGTYSAASTSILRVTTSSAAAAVGATARAATATRRTTAGTAAVSATARASTGVEEIHTTTGRASVSASAAAVVATRRTTTGSGAASASSSASIATRRTTTGRGIVVATARATTGASEQHATAGVGAAYATARAAVHTVRVTAGRASVSATAYVHPGGTSGRPPITTSTRPARSVTATRPGRIVTVTRPARVG